MGDYYSLQADIVSGYFYGDVTRPIGLKPNSGSVDDYLVYYKTWTGQDHGGEGDDTDVSLGIFGSWKIDRNDAGSDGQNGDIIIVRKSDRKVIKVTGDLYNDSNYTVTVITNVNYPELQRLRLLGII